MIAAALLACAANIAPATLEAVIAVESRGDPFVIFDNATHRAWHPHDRGEATALAQRLIAVGHRVDLGLMQVDSDNLPALGLSVAQAFEPCTNIRDGGAILTHDYAYAVRLLGPGQDALKTALSLYNTGDTQRGFRNGYVARYYGPGGRLFAVHAADRRATVRSHSVAPAAVRARLVALLSDSRRAHPVGDDAVYRLAALNIAIR